MKCISDKEKLEIMKMTDEQAEKEMKEIKEIIGYTDELYKHYKESKTV